MISSKQGMDISNFIQIEKKYNLYHIEIEGVQPWMYFRFSFWNYQLCKDLLGLSDNLQKAKSFKSYIRQMKSVIDIGVRGNAEELCKADILLYAHPRRVEVDGYFECIYTDWIAQRYPSSLMLEEPFKNGHLKPTRTEHLFYTDLLQIRAALYAGFSRCLKSSRYRKILALVRTCFEEPLKEIGRLYQYEIQYDSVYVKLTELVLEISKLKGELAKLLEKAAPKIIVEVVSYNRRCMVLNELAKERKIPTVELQHGTMHRAHAAYQFPDECGEICQFPDYMFVFSEYWKKCANLPIQDNHVKVTGYPYFERQIQKYTKKCSHKKERLNILFVSQGTIGRELSRLAADLSGLLDTDKYHLIYKLHPGEYEGWRDRNPWLAKSDIEVVDSPRQSIYEYFSECDIQIGVYSTAIYEGLGFGLTTFIYNIGHADTMMELCRQGYAVSVNNAQELYEHVLLVKSGGCGENSKFWRVGAEENICFELDRLLAYGDEAGGKGVQ